MRPWTASSDLRGPPLTLCDIMQRGYLSQVSVLVDSGIQVECRDLSGRTPLMLTAFVEPEEWGVGVARILIEAGVAMSSRDKQGMTALHHACIYERLPLAHVLLNAPDFNLAQKDRFGNTALHYAAMSGNVSMVRLLASSFHKYRQPFHSTNAHLCTARDEALRRGHAHCADLLFDVTSCPALSTSSDAPSPDIRSVSIVLSSEDDQDSSLTGDLVAEPLLGDLFHRPSGPRRARSANAVSGSRLHGRCLHRPSLPVFAHHHYHHQQRLQEPGPASLHQRQDDSEESEDAASTTTVSQKNGEGKAVDVVVAAPEHPPSPRCWKTQQAKRPSVLRERTHFHLNANRTVHYVNHTTSTRKAWPAAEPQRQHTFTFAGGSSQKLLPYEKDPGKIIHAASENDFRNTREHVLKLTNLTPLPVHVDADGMQEIPQPTSAVNDDHNSAKLKGGSSWRDGVRFLFHAYEYQWSFSWRQPARLLPPSVICPADEKEDTKERKVRRSASQVSELSVHSVSRLRKMTSSKRRVSASREFSTACLSHTIAPPPVSGSMLATGAGRMSVLDPGRDCGTMSPDTASSGTSSPLTRKRQEVKASQGATRQSNSKLPADSRHTPSPDNGRIFITHNLSNHGDVTSAGNGNTAIARRDRHLRQGLARSYPVPAVMESLVGEEETDGQEINVGPTAIDTSKLYVFSDVDDDDDDSD